MVMHFTIKPVIFGSIAARQANVKRVYNMIPGLGYVFSGNRLTQLALRPLVRKLYKIALKNSHRVFFQNIEDKNYFEQYSLVNKDKTRITLGSGVDLEHFYYVEPEIKEEKCTFLLLARMISDKGINEFVEAARLIREDNHTAYFQILGKIDKGNPNHIKDEYIEMWKKEKVVTLLEEKDDVRSVIAHADVVVLPSYYREGVPKSLLEAMAMGKAIITTNVPGCKETVIEGINGFLIPPRDIMALVESIRFMITHPRQRADMGKQSRKIAVDRFDVKKVNSIIIEAMDIR